MIFRYVLANHYMFQLAERPPADMAALLQMFPSVPPVVRRRAKELLEAIRECLQRYLTKPPTAAPAPPADAETEDAHMEVNEAVVAVKVPVSAGASLWSIGAPVCGSLICELKKVRSPWCIDARRREIRPLWGCARHRGACSIPGCVD